MSDRQDAPDEAKKDPQLHSLQQEVHLLREELSGLRAMLEGVTSALSGAQRAYAAVAQRADLLEKRIMLATMNKTVRLPGMPVKE